MCTCTLLLYGLHQLLSGHWTEYWECPSAPPPSLPLGLAYPKFGQLASSLMLSAVVSLLWENWRVCRTGRQPISGEQRDRSGGTRRGHTICSPSLPHCCTRPLQRHSLRFSSTETMLWLRLRVSSSCNGSKFSIFLMRFW